MDVESNSATPFKKRSRKKKSGIIQSTPKSIISEKSTIRKSQSNDNKDLIRRSSFEANEIEENLNDTNAKEKITSPKFLDINKSIPNDEQIGQNSSNTFDQNNKNKIISKPTLKKKRGRMSQNETIEKLDESISSENILEISINEDIGNNQSYNISTQNEEETEYDNDFHSRRRSKRPRKIKKFETEIYETNLESSLNESQNNENDDILETTTKRRGRSRKIQNFKEIDDSFNESFDNSEEQEFTPKVIRKKRKGRPSKNSVDEFAVDENDPTLNDLIKCAKCQEEMIKKNFHNHNLHKHYLLSWYEGMPSVDVYEENLVVSLLWKALKSGIKYFKCDTCGTIKKSAVGFWSHLCVCSKSEEELINYKVKCKLCDSFLLPCSVKMHMKLSHNPMSKIDEGAVVDKISREAATKAKTKLQEFISNETIKEIVVKKKSLKMMFTLQINELTLRLVGLWKRNLKKNIILKCKHKSCAFSTLVIDDMIEHFNSCTFKKEKKNKYICKFCKKFYFSENEIIEHLKSEHSEATQDEIQNADDYNVSEEEDNEKYDNDMAKLLITHKYQVPLRFKKRFCFLLREKIATPINYTPALKWTLEFLSANYQDLLFKDMMMTHEFPLVPFDEHEKYLPETKKSIHFSRLLMKEKIIDKTEEKLAWSTMELFEGRLEDNISTFFTGGPIWAMAWCPLPLESLVKENDQDQFLAVAVYSSMDQSTPIHPNVSFPGLIQIWNIGPLYHLKSKRAPKLAFALAHEFGLVHALVWCPSGAFQPPDRLGLLAAACSDGFIYIFSIPYRTETSTTLYLAKPVKVLQVDSEIVNSQCLCLAWYKGKGHHLIAGGFSNGMVAVWRIDTTTQLFQDSPTFLPIKFFPAHTRAVNCIDFIAQKDVRYIMTTSYDCSLSFWDLDNFESPIWTNKLRGFAVSAQWITHWFTAVCTFDEAYSLLSNTSLISPRNFSFQPTPFICHNSVCWTTSFNDWVNAVVQCTLAGELMIAYPRHVVALDNDRVFRKYRFPLTYSEVVRIDGKEDTLNLDQVKKQTKQDESHLNMETKSLGRPGTYKEIEKTGHGLLINDFPFDDFTKLPQESLKWLRNFEELRCVPPDLYPLTSINRVSWNPNINSYYWMAEGRQCGLLRIICISGAGPTNSFKTCQDNYLKKYFPNLKNT